MLIAGDIGGAKIDLAIYTNKFGPHAPLAQRQFHSADYPSLQTMVAQFLAQAGMSVDTLAPTEVSPFRVDGAGQPIHEDNPPPAPRMFEVLRF